MTSIPLDSVTPPPDPSFRAIVRSGAPRFVREAFGPVAAFYLAWKAGGLVAGILASTVFALALEWYERRRGRGGALALVSAAFVVVQALVGLLANSAVVYLAQPVLVSAIWGIAYLVSAAIGRPLIGVFADAWYPFPDEAKATSTYKRVFGFESVVWGVYLLARSGLRMLVLTTGNVGFFFVIQFVTGVPVLIGLVLWSIWYAGRRFERAFSDGTRPETAATATR